MTNLAFTVPESILLFVLLAFGLSLFAWVMHSRFRVMLLGAPSVRWDQVPRRIGRTLKFAIGQWRMPQDLAHGLLHIFIFWGFLVVSIRTVTLFGVGLTGNPGFHLPLLSETAALGRLYCLAKDLFVVLVIVGAIGSAYRRLVVRPRRFQDANNAEAVLILGTILMLMVTDGIMDGILLSRGAGMPFWAAPFGTFCQGVLGLFGLSSGALGTGIFKVSLWLHLVGIVGFLNYLPFGKHFHVITGIPNVFLSNLEPSGSLHAIPDLEEQESFGAAKVEDLSWKDLLDIYSCTECGRCVEDCPTDLTEKPLSQRLLNQELKKHLLQKAPMVMGKDLWGRSVEGSWDDEEKPLAGGVIAPETIWACTTCGACEDRCPVLIENVPRIVQMRRHMTLMQGAISPEMQTAMRGLERNSNPWNIGMAKRADWAEGLEVPLLADGAEVEYLLFVGCAGAFDERAKRVSQDLVRILKAAGIRFGILGAEEGCCGDSARRLGNEYLAQMQIEQNIETFKQYGVKRILTACPHGYHMLSREYRELGGEYEVTHAAVFIRDLLRSGKLKIHRREAQVLAYHDSCYLGRHNGVLQEPREVLEELAEQPLREPTRCGAESFCCGAGGGRMWLEEEEPRISSLRYAELKETGADALVVSCPFCLTMLEDGAKESGEEEQLKVFDLIEVVARGMETD